MPLSTRQRILVTVGFALSFGLASVPLAVIIQLLELQVAWVGQFYGSRAFNMDLMQVLEFFGIVILRLGGIVLGGLAASMLLLLPLLSLCWNAVLGCRRSLFTGLRGMLWPAALHCALSGLGLSLLAFFYVMVEGITGISWSNMPVELLAFLLASLGAWTVLPHSVDNLSAEHGLLAGCLAGLAGMIAVSPAVHLAASATGPLPQMLLICIAALVSGLVLGLFLPWLLRREQHFWLEIDLGGRTRSFRLGRRPLLLGSQPRAQLQVPDSRMPLLRFSLSGLSLFIEEQGQPEPSLVYPPVRIPYGNAEVRLRSFDERIDWSEYEPRQVEADGALEELPPAASPAELAAARQSIPEAAGEE